MNIKFNTKERFENLFKAATVLGFEKDITRASFLEPAGCDLRRDYL